MPLTVAEALRGATVEVPTLNGSKKLRVAPGTRHGTLQRLRGEGAPKLGEQERRERRHPLPLRDRAAERARRSEQQKAVDELAKAFDGNPRDRLFRGRTEARA